MIGKELFQHCHVFCLFFSCRNVITLDNIWRPDVFVPFAELVATATCGDVPASFVPGAIDAHGRRVCVFGPSFNVHENNLLLWRFDGEFGGNADISDEKSFIFLESIPFIYW